MKLEDLHQLSAQFRPTGEPEDDFRLRQLLVSMGYDPGNLYQELEMSSRYVQVHRDTSHANGLVTLHSHSFYELLCCRSNCGAEYLVGVERYRLKKGDFIIVPPGVSHRPLLPEHMTEPYVRDVLWISVEFTELLHRMFPDLDVAGIANHSLLRTADTPWAFLAELLRNAVTEWEQKAPGWDSIVTGSAITLLTHLQRAFSSDASSVVRAERPKLLERVMAYVDANLSHKISLAETARHFYVSSSTISHLFQQKMGVSFYRCVTQQRLIAAKRLIESRLPMETVAEQTGFSDYSTFYRAFKQEYGISPRQYRALYNESVPEGL